VTHQRDQKALDDVTGKAFMPIQLSDVEQVAGMLPVERGTKLAAKQLTN
jgi:hypothetical protein